MYQAKGNFTSAQKSAFNAIMLGLALLLSLNFLVGTVHLAVTAHEVLIHLHRVRRASKSLHRP